MKLGYETDDCASIKSLPPPSYSEYLTEVWKDTRRRAPDYPFAPSIKISHFANKHLIANYDATFIEVTQEDSLDAGKRLVDAGLRPLILNFADDLEAGGVVDNGNTAQEESLWRRTNLCATQLQTFYPLAMAPQSIQEGVYSPLVTIFKDSEENKCKDLETPWQAACIAVPGLKHPRTNKQNKLCLDDVNAMRAKAELIFQTAAEHDHDALVLGPLGCGVWCSPPKQVAEIFHNICMKHKGVVKHIVFACLTKGGASSTSNYTIFKNQFSTA